VEKGRGGRRFLRNCSTDRLESFLGCFGFSFRSAALIEAHAQTLQALLRSTRHADDPRAASCCSSPEHGKPRVFDVRGEAVCPVCNTRWRAKRDNTFKIVGNSIA
jgi:uncharacterized Zn-finger protein